MISTQETGQLATSLGSDKEKLSPRVALDGTPLGHLILGHTPLLKLLANMRMQVGCSYNGSGRNPVLQSSDQAA